MNQLSFASAEELSSKEKVEQTLFLSAVHQMYGYDFTQYSQDMMARRLNVFKSKYRVDHLSELIPLILHKKELLVPLLNTLSITVTEFFRSPTFFRKFSKHVIPVLKTYPFISLWCAGCATGEEAYSWAIIMKESNLLDRTRIYATDINQSAINKAKIGEYKLADLNGIKKKYKEMGGKKKFEDYCQISGDNFRMSNDLKDSIVFSHHNLISDGVFSEMHVISCRNVMIYFNESLKVSCFSLFYNSLIKNGFLCLGEKEIMLCNQGGFFSMFDAFPDVYQRVKKVGFE